MSDNSTAYLVSLGIFGFVMTLGYVAYRMFPPKRRGDRSRAEKELEAELERRRGGGDGTSGRPDDSL